MEKRAEQTHCGKCFFLQFCDVAKLAINKISRKNGNIQSNYMLSSEKQKTFVASRAFFLANSSSKFTNQDPHH